MDYDGEEMDYEESTTQEFSDGMRTLEVTMRGAPDGSNSYSLGSPLRPFGDAGVMKSMELGGTSGFNVADFSISGLGVVPDAPLWWDPYNHWITAEEDVLQQCAQAMLSAQTTKVDFIPKYDQFMIKGISYGLGQASATFHIRQFKAPDNQSGFLLEVSRQSGDSLTFSQFFQELKSKVDPDSSLMETGGFYDMSQFDMDFGLDDIPIDAESVEGIMVLASSSMLDQTREGMCILAGLTEQNINHQEVIASPFFSTVMTEALRSSDSECNRSGSLALLRMLSSDLQSLALEQVALDLVPDLIEILNRPEQLEALQVNRQVADCLSSLRHSDSSVCTQLAVRRPVHLTDPHVMQIVSELVASVQ